jgi:hypothetical protein
MLAGQLHHGLLIRQTATIDFYRSMDMAFWLPEAEAVLAQVEV